MTCENISEIKEKKKWGFHPKKWLKDFQHKLYESQYLYLIFCFLVPVAVMYAIYLILWTGFAGGGTPLVLDLNAQYVYFFEALRKCVYGDASLLYSFARSLGGEFMGIYAYYLASPLSYIIALFPAQYIQEALTVLFLLKVGLCGLSFAFYLHKRSKTPNKLAIFIFSMLYALCSYGVVHQSNTMWIDALMWLPIFTYALENLITRRKFKLYVISLAVILISNYYIGYMVCIYAVLYFLYYYFAKAPEDRNPRGERLHFIRTGARFAVFSVLAAAIAAFMLIMAYYSLTFGKTDFSNPNWAFKANFNILDFLVKLLPGAYDTVDYPGLPFVYCGIMTLVLLPIYFTTKSISLREKLASGALVAIFLISFIINPIDLIWHGFSQPNWLNARYSFIFCFIILVLAYKAFGNLKRTTDKFIICICGLILLLAAVAEKFEFESFVNVEKTFRLGSLTIDGKFFWSLGCIWFAVVFAIAVCVLLCARIRVNSKKTRKCVTSALAAVICLEMLLNGVTCIMWFNEDVYFSRYDNYYDRLQQLRPVVDQLYKKDPGFYRTEKTTHRTINENMALELKGISSSTSTLNEKAIDLLHKLGYVADSHRSMYSGGTPFTDSMLGIKYVIDTKQSDNYQPLLYNEVEGIDSKLFNIYQNPYAMSMAYGVSDAMREYSFEDEEGDPKHNTFFARYNDLLTNMVGSELSLSMFKPVNYDEIMPMGCEEKGVGTLESRTFYTEEDDEGKIAFLHTAPYTGHYYFYSETREKYPPKLEIEFNDRYVGEYFGTDTNHVFYVGYFEEGDTINIFISLPEDTTITFNAFFKYLWCLDEETYESSMQKLMDGPQMNIDKSSTDDHITGKISTDVENQMILTTIPYDEGWKVFLDGKQIKTYEALTSVMAFDITETGEHTLTFDYDPDCYHMGYKLTVIGICIFVVLAAAEFVLKRTLFKNRIPTYADEYWVLEDFEEETDELYVPKEQVEEAVIEEVENTASTEPTDDASVDGDNDIS